MKPSPNISSPPLFSPTEQIEALREKVKESEKQNALLEFTLKTKDEDIEQLKQDIERLKGQMENEGAWRDKVTNQLEEIEKVKENTNKERLEKMTMVGFIV